MKKHKVTYYYDALCGWCYGFSPVIEKIYHKYKDMIDFEVVSGGLFLGDRVGAINDIAPYIKAGAYKTVEERTGTKFGEKFINESLEHNTMVLNSLPPAIALCVVKENYPEKEMAFAAMLHKAIYVDGVNPDDIANFSNYAQKLDINLDDFNTKIRDPKYVKIAKEEFATVASDGVRGYPATLLKSGEDRILLSNGYVDFEVLDHKLSQLI